MNSLSLQRCGIVTYYTHEDAVNALDTLHETHTFPGMDLAMVLKWVDQDLQKRRKMGADGAGGAGMYGELLKHFHSSGRPSSVSHQDATLVAMIGTVASAGAILAL